ncbi:uncharacterized protein DUF4235 [Motilibacter rhizosphaerae]|uniref:Uncharacterized protein DUF4235 n=1 Tax=Motilibacter rhizosphaerae TaxID=598652 RepID=A0A4Q7NX65_9ACTN|nr:DUF4235 domain-containing protein [Motilibacter rhizosphaerae]RZS90992.1 uncharacterized protein DUF4235 [Motilibacter rhizosphaerae]
MAKQGGGVGFKLLTAGGTVAAAWVARKSVTTAWKLVTGNEPPANPEDPEVEWAEAVGWALLSGAVIGLARLAASRQSAVVYRRVTGVQPADANAAAS